MIDRQTWLCRLPVLWRLPGCQGRAVVLAVLLNVTAIRGNWVQPSNKGLEIPFGCMLLESTSISQNLGVLKS